MSASIIWEPVNPNPRTLHVMAPSWFMAALEKAGLGLPRQFGEIDLPVLRGMAATIDKEANPFQELIDVIDKHGPVEVWAEY